MKLRQPHLDQLGVTRRLDVEKTGWHVESKTATFGRRPSASAITPASEVLCILSGFGGMIEGVPRVLCLISSA
jgi:hypothetical protein